ncbi:MAG: hypothetical protein COU46_02270 [Candidatus Niyogibacteria bacterium CG10_big_fil_rev_8_21_14_0_10_42_19]|uniref:Band 7 domain-containing protein n=1 Tax=Candidatus Niyogibacteria bacterium CG10_big_fil_rev_8_21_14_0_10_42_19 TaxID=1974725 RepID=A0A2H0TFH8_9BACT|nr:MAG: hypothetical protein COU46_02270 [Candidatus Niyogibacteria bacterium CG10_big_fil_rev_8_21_14_0_10_42_19]
MLKMPEFLKKSPLEEKKTISFQKTQFYAGWVLFCIIVALAPISAVMSGFPWMFFWLGLASLYVATCLHEIHDPNEAYLFRFGKMLGRLGSGWFLTVPYLWEIRPVSREVVVLQFEKQGMFTKDSTAIELSITAVVQIGEKEDDLAHALELKMEDRDMLFKQIILSKIRTEVGKQSFTELNKGQENIEKEVTKDLRKELKKYGYRIKEAEIYDLDEKVLAEAERIKIIGKARGEEASSISEPFKDNWPAAIVALGSKFFEKPVKELKNAAANKKGINAVVSAIGGIKSATEKILGKEGSSDESSS